MVVVAAVVLVLAIGGALAENSCARRCPHCTAQLPATAGGLTPGTRVAQMLYLRLDELP
jgi:hypothetical protein